MIIEQLLKVADKERELWQLEGLVKLAPIELPYCRGDTLALARCREMGCDERRVGLIQKPCRYTVVLRRHQ
jgi:hypothetical protein